jgi:hypothetical protein
LPRASGSFFTPFGVWAISAYHGSGEMKTFAKRSFCPRDNEAEIMLGSLDMAPSDLRPS